MKVFLLFTTMLYSMTVDAFDITESKFTAPDPAALCKSNEAMFGVASVIYADCEKDIASIVVSKIDSSHSFADLQQFVSRYQPDGSFTDYDITDALLTAL